MQQTTGMFEWKVHQIHQAKEGHLHVYQNLSSLCFYRVKYKIVNSWIGLQVQVWLASCLSF